MFQGGRHQDVAGQFQDLLSREALAYSSMLHRALGLLAGEEVSGVETLRVVDLTLGVAHRNKPAAHFLEELRDDRPDVPKALYHHSGSRQREAKIASRADDGVDAATPVASRRPKEPPMLSGFPVTTPGTE